MILNYDIILCTYSGAKNIGRTNTLDWAQTQHAEVTDSSAHPGNHRRLKRSPISPLCLSNPICPLNVAIGKFGLKFFPAAGAFVNKLVPVGKKLSVLNVALG